MTLRVFLRTGVWLHIYNSIVPAQLHKILPARLLRGETTCEIEKRGGEIYGHICSLSTFFILFTSPMIAEIDGRRVELPANSIS